ncbi:putative trichohyalin isoform X4 [Apostichopus japonicus]|uniref:Putative trichohyalin isoform X4 n=1 Tax=Stichopus japonicus TaxID=307972 RepID=A0A2G8JYT0_STIJA|nr:putative trichohyalin isoform X4 [Apostichopus japonicus]
MGFEDDLENLYQILDSPCRGYVDSQQIQDFHQTLYLKKIGADQVDAALKQVCGDQKVCSKKQFVPLLLELERRRTIEERAWWDFKSLDMNGMDQITIQDALLLFKITLGDKFTMIYWGKFVLSRNYSKEPTSFEEVKMWLCNVPDGSSEPCSNQAIFEEISNLQTEKNKMDYRNFRKIKALQDDDFVQTLEAREKQQYQDRFRQGARRKLNRWVQLGVESMMFDDGVDVGRNIRNQVTVQDLLEAMDEKYDILREKLIWESLRSHIGETIWSTMPESEREEQVLKIKTKHQQLIAQKEEHKVAQLSIGYQNYSSRLVAMMGYHREEQLQFMQDTQEKRGTLRADGKSEEKIVDTLTVDYSKLMEGSTTCGELLCDLQKRHMAEREFLVAVLKGVQGRVLFSAEMVSEYILYVQQQILASREGEDLSMLP